MTNILRKIKRFWTKLRLQPIRVFCFHQVSDVFDPVSMWECDWMSTKDFKTKIYNLQKEYTFISLPVAYEKLKLDSFRFKKYAVLTADDGSKTLENILPWLHEQHIPITLFLNGSCLDGKSYRETPAERYYTKEELMNLDMDNISFGHHGWDHRDLRDITKEEFESSIALNIDALSFIPNVLPFWAYPYGIHSSISDMMLHQRLIIPVYMDGYMNYKFENGIQREEL